MCPDSIIRDYLGLLIFFLALCMQGLLLRDKAHGPEKIELFQHTLKWKEKANSECKLTGFFWQKKKKTSQQLQFVCDLNHYIAERQ